MANRSQRGPEPALIFIPDISGFTEFVTDTEIRHSQHIIEELLEKLIDCNALNLEVSEIEGDAILFYRMGKAPAIPDLLEQVRSMYLQFHKHLKRYEHQRICQCGACIQAHNLRLKFIAHYGVLSLNKVKSFEKLFGKDVIVAHRLLKNDIPHDEYVLVTHQLAPDESEMSHGPWVQAITGAGEYDFGEIDYVYSPLAALQDEVPELKITDYNKPETPLHVVTSKFLFDAPLQLVFDVLSDVGFRHHWQHGLVASTELNGNITHNGSTHRCVINESDRDPFLVSYDFEVDSDRVTWTETDEVNSINTVIQLKRIDEAKTEVTFSAFAPSTLRVRIALLFGLRRAFQKRTSRSFQALADHLSKLVSTGEKHREQVILYPED